MRESTDEFAVCLKNDEGDECRGLHGLRVRTHPENEPALLCHDMGLDEKPALLLHQKVVHEVQVREPMRRNDDNVPLP